MSLSDDRLYNILIEILASLNKNTSMFESNSEDVARWAKATYDIVPLIDARLAYFLSEFRAHKAEHRENIDKAIATFLEKASADRKEALEAIIAIRAATAVASNDAGDAARAAQSAAVAATAAREATGSHHTQQSGGSTPSSYAAVARDLLRGLPWWARFFLALALLTAATFGGQAIEAKWGLLRGREPQQHQRALPE